MPDPRAEITPENCPSPRPRCVPRPGRPSTGRPTPTSRRAALFQKSARSYDALAGKFDRIAKLVRE